MLNGLCKSNLVEMSTMTRNADTAQLSLIIDSKLI